MSYTVEKLVKSVGEILTEYPLSEDLKKQIDSDRKAIRDIIEGKDKRKILIIGPCSAWPEQSVINYAKNLKEISDKVSDKIKIIMRVYTQKPRTNLGWTGPVNQPDPFKLPDIEKGIIYCRKMMLEVLEIGLPIADEALFTNNDGYFTDLLSWIAIGARSSEDQEHRIYASMINHPVGIKNPTSGNLTIAINSLIAAQNSHVFLLNGRQIKTNGNKHAHLVLRGGDSKSNIYNEDLKKSCKMIKEKSLSFPSIIVDVSHDNSIDPATEKKDYKSQPQILLRVLDHMKEDENLMNSIKGFMVESFIKSGSQNLSDSSSQIGLDLGGLSITDSCIGLEETKNLIDDLYNKL